MFFVEGDLDQGPRALSVPAPSRQPFSSRSGYEAHVARGKNETWGAIGLIGLYFRGFDVPKLPHVGGRNGNDTHASSRSENNTKSFNYPYRKKYVGHR
jgi:hypothetical protein